MLEKVLGYFEFVDYKGKEVVFKKELHYQIN